ncbi:MAG: hypothetical protein ISS15_16680 [Alphaproteobacteria bacterium]|nr:hypothetical protein [Alphaproteobacteria bacterium]MBL6937879.1 hypothetical protein [Alphaproteobacteria bacterium]MBL7099296.1 hypothetical protein [Alphaproteobacteria bacterium]
MTAATRRKFAVRWAGLLAGLVLLLAPVAGQATALTVAAVGDLPGFSAQDAPQYLAVRMGQSGVSGWTFVPAADGGAPAADRVEWRIELLPYAGGSMRQFIPIPAVQRMFGARRVIAVEVRIYLKGEYQTLAAGQAVVHGGPDDADLAKLVGTITQDLLGETGALHAIEQSSAPAPKP